MGFTCYKFLLAFLPATLILYFLMRKFNRNTLAKCVMAVASAVFYWFYGAVPFFILIGDCIINWFLSKLLQKDGKSTGKKVILALSIILNVGLLLYFKYFNFFAENVAAVRGAEFTAFDIIQPAAISYYTFQQIAWLVDSYRGETGKYTFPEYAAFIFFFPKIAMGPIILHDEFMGQLNDKKKFLPNAENLGTGFIWLSIGMAKKVMLEPMFAGCASFGFDPARIPLLSMPEAWACSIAYTIQLYLDFSGYCDIAAGVSKMFNFDLPVNFNSPYKAISIGDFWKRWHITLTRFLRKYIYFSLGGNRKGKVRTYINMLTIFVISGFWHGANWTFILWGTLHGVIMIIERICGKTLEKIPKGIRWAVTFIAVDIGWVLFNSHSIGEAGAFLQRMFQFGSLTPAAEFYNTVGLNSYAFITEHLNIAVPLLFIATLCGLVFTKNVYEKKYEPNFRTSIAVALMFAFSFLSLSDVATFIYFQF